MAIDIDDELYQDFLVEAGETLEQLGDSLVTLEQEPENLDILNHVFRGFHNIKGGGGFLGLTALVELCHAAEDVFNILRQGDRIVDAHLMDVVLSALDVVNEMIEIIRSGNEPNPADPELLQRLRDYANPQALQSLPKSPQESQPLEAVDVIEVSQAVEEHANVEQPSISELQQSEQDQIEQVAEQATGTKMSEFESEGFQYSDEEYATLVDALKGEEELSKEQTADTVSRATPNSSAGTDDPIEGGDTIPRTGELGQRPEQLLRATSGAKADDEISDNEFESLLDQLHGPGQFGGVPKQPTAAASVPPTQAKQTASVNKAPAASGNSDEITDEEFEELLDQLHGPGQFTGVREQQGTPATAGASTGSVASEDISDEEFEDILDELHGKGQAVGKLAKPEKAAPPPKNSNAKITCIESAKDQVADDEISDQEFDELLDQLHGVGAAPGVKPIQAASIMQPDRRNKTDKSPVKATPQPRKGGQPKSATQEKTVRVDTARLDDIMNMVGELVLARNRLTTLDKVLHDEDLTKAVGHLNLVTTDLQAAVMKTRMQPIKKAFGRFPRVVRDLARSLSKEVKLEMRGEETDLDKSLVEALGDPLVHLVRNSIDHGIEMPAEREAMGKSRVGLLELSADQEGDHILLTIKDDGAGISAETLRDKVVEKGLMEQAVAERLSEKDCFDLIFLPGLSSKEQVSDVSGRGVGMDVVKTRINQLNGSVTIDSERGKGTTINIQVPLTLAIVPTLMVVVGDRTFALPLLSIIEILEYDSSQLKSVDGQSIILNRDMPTPLYFLRNWLLDGKSNATKQTAGGHVILVGVGAQQYGFVVDELIGQEEVVIKPLGAMLQGTPGLAGATITGTGRIALILDAPGLISAYASRSYGEVA